MNEGEKAGSCSEAAGGASGHRDHPKRAQESFKSYKNRQEQPWAPLRTPKTPPEDPKSTPKNPRSDPRASKNDPTQPQALQRSCQETPRELQEQQRTPQQQPNCPESARQLQEPPTPLQVLIGKLFPSFPYRMLVLGRHGSLQAVLDGLRPNKPQQVRRGFSL